MRMNIAEDSESRKTSKTFLMIMRLSWYLVSSSAPEKDHILLARGCRAWYVYGWNLQEYSMNWAGDRRQWTTRMEKVEF